MRHANGVVSEFCVAEYVKLTPAPKSAVAVLVGSQILKVGLHHLAVRVSGIFQWSVCSEGKIKGVVYIDVSVEHESIVVRVGHVTSEFTQRSPARPSVEAFFRIQKGAIRVFRQGKPEAGCLTAGRHIVSIGIVRVRDPVGRYRVIGRQQGILTGLTDAP